MGKLLEVSRLGAAYGATRVLHDISFSLDAGHITAILGANGAGKTSTLRALCQTVRTTGSIVFDGQQIVGKATENVVRMGVAHVPDGRGTFTALSVEENLRLGAYVRADRAELARDMEKAFTRFPLLKNRRHQQAGTLSGGEQQMLAMARAIMLNPEVVLLDEPSMGLAPILVAEVFRIIERLKSEGVTMLLVEQFAAAALAVADYGYVLENGRISVHGPASRLRDDPAVKAAYLGGGH